MPRRLAALAALLAAVLLVACGQTNSQTKSQAHSVVKATAEHAAVASQSVPNPACFPPIGAAHMGSCAPVQAMGAANAQAKAAGDPDHVTGTIGVDVSSYQGCSINWGRVGVSFAIFKATEYTGYTDECVAHNVASAKAAHKPYGLYDFLRPSPFHSATAEADHFVAVANAVGGNTSLPPTADVEVNAGLSPSHLHDYVCAWEARVKTRLHRRTVITYTGNWFWGPSIAGDNCGGSLLWDSAYASFAITPFSWVGHGGITIWQYSDGIFGPTPHINGWDSDVIQKGTLNDLAGATARPSRAQRHASLTRHRERRAQLHVLIEKHHCRPGEHAQPPSYHTVCGRWLRLGEREVTVIHRYEREGVR